MTLWDTLAMYPVICTCVSKTQHQWRGRGVVRGDHLYSDHLWFLSPFLCTHLCTHMFDIYIIYTVLLSPSDNLHHLQMLDSFVQRLTLCVLYNPPTLVEFSLFPKRHKSFFQIFSEQITTSAETRWERTQSIGIEGESKCVCSLSLVHLFSKLQRLWGLSSHHNRFHHNRFFNIYQSPPLRSPPRYCSYHFARIYFPVLRVLRVLRVLPGMARLGCSDSHRWQTDHGHSNLTNHWHNL